MLSKLKYKNKYYQRHRDLTLSSAKKIIQLFPNTFNPKSVLDIGCGTGEWMSLFKTKYPSCNLVGIDGHWIKSDDLICKDIDLFNLDLSSDLTSKVFEKKYDLIICLETITDLSEQCGDNLIEKICKSSDICLFSSGTPVQTHTPHKNRQWQSYWRSLFEKNGFKVLDVIRPAIWNDNDVGAWYRQNCFLFVEKSWLKNNLEWEDICSHQKFPLDIVHPELLPPLIQNMKLKKWLKIFPKVIINTFKK